MIAISVIGGLIALGANIFACLLVFLGIVSMPASIKARSELKAPPPKKVPDAVGFVVVACFGLAAALGLLIAYSTVPY